MIQVFHADEQGNVSEVAFDSIKSKAELNNKWVNLVNPTDKEIEIVSLLTQIEEDILKAPLDDEERSRIEHEDDYSLVLFDIPIIEEEEGSYYSYYTLPLGFVLVKDFVVTISLKETTVTRDFAMGRVKTFSTHKRTRFLFQAMYNTSTKYLHYLKQIDKASGRIQSELKKSTKNKELIQLLDLENSLVYFTTSLKGNDMIINKLTKTKLIDKYEEDEELLEDVKIETQQAMEMASMYTAILASTMDAYASVIGNNQNNIMKILTSVTLMLSIPTLISGIWGMNTWVPGQDKWWGFAIAVGAIFGICGIVGIVLHKKKLL